MLEPGKFISPTRSSVGGQPWIQGPTMSFCCPRPLGPPISFTCLKWRTVP